MLILVIGSLILENFYKFINGFYILKISFPVMWITFLMVLAIFSFIAITFLIAYILDPMVIVYGSYGIIVIVAYFGYQYFKLYRQQRLNKTSYKDKL